MQLYTRCSSCQNNIIIKSSASDRIALARKNGEEFQVNCECGNRYNIHVDDVKAKQDKTTLILFLISLVIGIIATIMIWNTGWFISLTISFPFLVLASVQKTQSNAINVFNHLNYDSKRKAGLK